MEKNKFNPVNLIRRYIRFYSSQSTVEGKLFWRIDSLVVLMGIASVMGTVIEGLGIWAVLTGIMFLVTAVLFAILCYYSGNDCKRFYVYLCLVLNCVLGPAVFLTNGGINSGMPMYLCGFILLCGFCSTEEDRHITSSTALLVDILLLIISVAHPEIVVPIEEDFVHTDIILSFAVLAVTVLILISSAVSEISTQRYDDVNLGLIASFSNILEFRSHETGSHIKNMRSFMAVLLKNANSTIPKADFKKKDIHMISSAALLHDIGKVAVPDYILNKPDALTKEEYEIIKMHTVDGCRMIESMKDYQDPQYYEYCYTICRYHHEKYDGTGYPDGLKGEEIPLIAQIAGIADAFEALISERVYKGNYSIDQAADIIINKSPGFYSDRVTDCFIHSLPELKKVIADENAGGGDREYLE